MSKKQFNIAKTYITMGQSGQVDQSPDPDPSPIQRTAHLIAALIHYGYTAKDPAITPADLEKGRRDE